jgi:hypothetical protein
MDQHPKALKPLGPQPSLQIAKAVLDNPNLRIHILKQVEGGIKQPLPASILLNEGADPALNESLQGQKDSRLRVECHQLVAELAGQQRLLDGQEVAAVGQLGQPVLCQIHN